MHNELLTGTPRHMKFVSQLPRLTTAVVTTYKVATFDHSLIGVYY
jgi:hypothetical protein